MPFAQVHYPFDNREWFEHHYPGDFIVEYIGQTRGWFYTLHVLATALFDRPAFSHVRQPRHRARRRRPEDVEEPEQLPGPDGDVRHPRRRRHAVVAAVVVDPARQRRDGHRGRHPRHGPPGAAAAVELVVLPGAVRQRRRSSRRRAHRLDERRSTATSCRRRATWSPTSPTRWTPTTCSARASTCGLPRRAHQLVRAPQPQPLLAGRPRRHRHDAHRARRASRGPSRRCCRSCPRRSIEGCTRRPTSRARQRAPHRLADRRRAAGRSTIWSTRWISCATCARPRCRSARRISAGFASRSQSVTVAAPDAERLRDFVDLIADEVNVRRVELTTDIGEVAAERAAARAGQARATPRQGRAGRHQGAQGRRLDRRRRRRHGRRPRARRRRVSTRSGRRPTTEPAPGSPTGPA